MSRKSTQPQLSFGEGPVRLQRILAAAGFGSRRGVEQLILEGRVEVDGEVVTQLGTSVDPSVSEVSVDGEKLRVGKPLYFAVNKPVGVVTTNHDPQGRPRVIDFAPPQYRVFPVGRLDQYSEGLILLTNDGWLAQRLTHPRYGVEKIYQVVIAGTPPADLPKKLERGVHLAEGVVRAKHVKVRGRRGRSTELEVVLDEGKNREIRRMLARLGNKVQRLRRIAFGPLRLGDLPSGACRPLTFDEIQKLREAATGKMYKPKKRDKEPVKMDLPPAPVQPQRPAQDETVDARYREGYAGEDEETDEYVVSSGSYEDEETYEDDESLGEEFDGEEFNSEEFEGEEYIEGDGDEVDEDEASPFDDDDEPMELGPGRRTTVIGGEASRGRGKRTREDEGGEGYEARGGGGGRSGNSAGRKFGGRKFGGRKFGSRPAGGRGGEGRSGEGRGSGGARSGVRGAKKGKKGAGLGRGAQRALPGRGSRKGTGSARGGAASGGAASGGRRGRGGKPSSGPGRGGRGPGKGPGGKGPGKGKKR